MRRVNVGQRVGPPSASLSAAVLLEAAGGGSMRRVNVGQRAGPPLRRSAQPCYVEGLGEAAGNTNSLDPQTADAVNNRKFPGPKRSSMRDLISGLSSTRRFSDRN